MCVEASRLASVCVCVRPNSRTVFAGFHPSSAQVMHPLGFAQLAPRIEACIWGTSKTKRWLCQGEGGGIGLRDDVGRAAIMRPCLCGDVAGTRACRPAQILVHVAHAAARPCMHHAGVINQQLSERWRMHACPTSRQDPPLEAQPLRRATHPFMQLGPRGRLVRQCPSSRLLGGVPFP